MNFGVRWTQVQCVGPSAMCWLNNLGKSELVSSSFQRAILQAVNLLTLSVGHRLYSDEPGGPYYYYSISTSTAITTTATITTTTMTNFRLILS